MFNFWGSNEETSQHRPMEVTTQSWYPSSVTGSSNASRPATPTGTSPGNFSSQKTSDRPQSPSHVSQPVEAAGIISALKDKSVDELRKLLHDKDAYLQFLLSLDRVKTQTNVKEDLRKETLLLAGENLEKEARILELRNQCKIIRTSELASALEKVNELERQKDEMLKFCSPASLHRRLQESMNETEEEAESMHQQFLDKEMEVASFVQKYKKLRLDYHKRALILLAAKTSSVN